MRKENEPISNDLLRIARGQSLRGGPVQAAIRPSAEYVFVEEVDLFRVNGDLIGRFGAPAVPFRPYGKAGAALEVVGDDEDTAFDEGATNFGINLGAGVLFNSFFVEGTLGLIDISDFRIAAGYRF